MKSYIYINEAEFYAYHGVMLQERVVGNTFLVNLVVEVDIVAASESDKLEDTLNYADIFEVVKKEMAIPSNLLEHVAGRIIQSLHAKFSTIRKIEISVTKKNPPINGLMNGIGVRLVEE